MLQDIDKVLQDTRVVQKDINQLTEKTNRIFVETDELIFKNAKKDEQSRQAYKLLAALQNTCESIIKTVEGTMLKFCHPVLPVWGELVYKTLALCTFIDTM